MRSVFTVLFLTALSLFSLSTAALRFMARETATRLRNIDGFSSKFSTEMTAKKTTTIARRMKNASDDLTRELFLSSICAFVAGDIIRPNAVMAMERNDDGDDGWNPHRFVANVLTLSLRSLPNSGCYAVPITISRNLDIDESSKSEQYLTYLAVVDSGSPFLTAPTDAFRQTKTMMTKKIPATMQSVAFSHKKIGRENDNDRSYEQYGTTIGSVQWRMAPWVTLIGNGSINVKDVMNYYNNTDRSKTVDIEPIIIEDGNNIVLGIPSDIIQEETGGIFIGLMAVDKNRPTFMQQFGYFAFSFLFGNRMREEDERVENKKKSSASLVLWSSKQSDDNGNDYTKDMIDRFDPSSMKLFDLTKYGPNLHHYGVLCNKFECRWGGNNSVDDTIIDFDCYTGQDRTSSLSLSRPLLAVFDTGLSGCIFSDTLYTDIKKTRHQQQSGGPKDDDSNTKTNSDNDDDEPIGCTVWLPTIGDIQTTSMKLTSVSNYWRFQSFRLPWWYDNSDDARSESGVDNDGKGFNNYPHVVVLGSAFWRNPDVQELAVDTRSNRAKIITIA